MLAELKKLVAELRETAKNFNEDGNVKDEFKLMDLMAEIDAIADEAGVKVTYSDDLTSITIEL